MATNKRPRLSDAQPSIEAQKANAARISECRDARGKYFADDDPHTIRAAALTHLPDVATTSSMLSELAREAAQSASAPDSEADQAALELNSWMATFLPAPCPLALRRFEHTGRGLAAVQGLKAGEVALSIPLSLVLTSDRLPTHPLLDGWHEDLRLAIALLYEPIREPGGAWARYTSMLPETPPSALHWSEAQLGRLAGTPVPQQVAALRETLHTAHAAAFPLLSDAIPATFPPAAFSRERFVWAYSIVETRGLVLALPRGRGDADAHALANGGCECSGEAAAGEGENGGSSSGGDGVGDDDDNGTRRTTALVPVVDMLNHAVHAPLAWPKVATCASTCEQAASSSTGSAAGASDAAGASGAAAGTAGAVLTDGRALELRVLYDVPAATEVCLYYGRLACLQTLQYYGFIEPSALAHEAISLDLDLPEEEVAIEVPAAADGGVDGAADPATALDEENEVLCAAAQAQAQAQAQTQQDARLRLLGSRHLHLSDHFLRDSGPLAPQLLATLDVLSMPAEELLDASCNEAGDGTGDAPSADADADAMPATTAVVLTPQATLRVCDALRNLLSGLADSLLPPPGVPEPAAASASPEDKATSAGIEEYVAFQQRVLRHALAETARIESAAADAQAEAEEGHGDGAET